VTNCPTTEILSQLLAGDLDETAAQSVDAHVRECSSCQSTLDRLSDDTELRQWAALSQPPTPQPCEEQALARLLGNALPGTGADSARTPGTVTFSVANTLREGADGTGRDGGPKWATAPGGTAVEGRSERAGGDLPDIPGYAVLGILGEGGMGVVYKARHLGLDRVVALKMILAGATARREEVARFRAEALAVARLQHPHIVQVHEVGEHAGRPFFSLEFVEGGSLARRLAGAPQPPRPAAALLEALARAVQYAHEQGIVHRDLKPANVLLTSAGAPKITDFGLAKRLDTDSGQTHTGQVMGTPSYMAPEQAAGDVRAIRPAADVHALGAILYELLTGRPPFRGASVLETLEQVRGQEPLAPSQLQPKTPRDLDTICMRCLRKDPAKRYRSAGELAEDLRRFLAGEPIKARPVGRVERLYRWARRKPALAALWLVLTVGVAVSSALALGFYNASQKADRSASSAKESAANERAARRAAEDSLINMYEASGFVADEQGKPATATLWFANAARLAKNDPERAAMNARRVRTWLRQLWVPACALLAPYSMSIEEPLRQLTFHPEGDYLLALAGSKGVMWNLKQRRFLPFACGEHVLSAAWSPDGTLLAMVTQNGEVFVAEFPAGAPPQRLPSVGASPSLAFSPDGSLLAVAGARTIYVWNLKRKQLLQGTLEHPHQALACNFAPDGKHLVTACEDGMARMFKIGDRAMGAEPSFQGVPHKSKADMWWGPSRVLLPLFVDEGRSLITLGEAQLLCWDARTGKQRSSTALPGRPTCFVASPAGTHVVVAGWTHQQGSGDARVWDAAKQQFQPSHLKHSQMVLAAAFSPDGGSLFTTSMDYMSRLWSVPDGRLLYTLPQHSSSEPWQAACSPDGRFLATATDVGAAVSVWARPLEPPYHQITTITAGSRRAPIPAALSGDGKYLLPRGSRPDPSVTRVYDATTGQPAGPPLRSRGEIVSGAFSPDGNQVLLLTQNGNFATFIDWRSDRVVAVGFLDAPPRRASYTPDGRQAIVVCEGGKVFWLDPGRGTVLRRREERVQDQDHISWGGQRWLRMSPDGQTFVTNGYIAAAVWDTARGELRYPPLKFLSFDTDISSDGRLLVAAGDAGPQVQIWDCASGKSIRALHGHPQRVYQARFSPDGKYLLTACADGMARLWDWQAGRLACSAMAHGESVPGFAASYERQGVTAVGFSTDGRWLCSAGSDGTARVWDRKSAKAIMPPVSLASDAISVESSSDGTRFIVTGRDHAQIIDLADLTDGVNVSSTPEDLCSWAEVISSQRIEEGGGLVNLSAFDWYSLVNTWYESHPDHLSLRSTAEQQLTWHRHAATSAMREKNWNNALWHLERLVRAERGGARWWVLQGEAYRMIGNHAEAAVAFRKAIGLEPENGQVYLLLGLALNAKNDREGALAAYRKAARVSSTSFTVLKDVGWYLEKLGDFEGSVAAYRQAMELNSTDAGLLNNLGWSLHMMGNLDGAIAAYRKALAHDPNFALAHANLGRALYCKGAFRASRDALLKALNLPDRARREYAQYHLKHAEAMLPYEGRLPDFLSGKLKPRDLIEALELAEFFHFCDRKYSPATRFYQAAFALDPKSGTLADPWTRYPAPVDATRYNAPCAAVLAGTGQSSDSPAEADRAPLRQQALSWLRQDLAYYQQRLGKTPSAQDKKLVHDRMGQWLDDRDFTAVREERGLAGLPSAEREGWQQFWSEVRRLHDLTSS
jgi:WD40 repeat protein/tetratricopeptide (TPR) repeat protein/tRNA A-37 threonylcarbamoyl transferase component Bud32